MNQVIETLQKMGPNAPRLYVITTGAGSGFQDRVWKQPGISNSFIGAEMSYAPEKTTELLGFTPSKFVSLETAIDLAMAAYMKAWKTGHSAIGLGLTASVCSTRPRKGEHQIIVAAFTENACYTMVVPISKGDFWEWHEQGKITDEELQECIRNQRRNDGELADRLALYLLTVLMEEPSKAPIPGLTVEKNMDLARARILTHPYFCANGTRKKESDILSTKTMFYPGAFNPPHDGHFKGAETALITYQLDCARRASLDARDGFFDGVRLFDELGRKVIFSTTVNPPHKNPLTPAEMLQRACMMKGRDFLLTEGDPLYIDKANKFPGAHFIVGADALHRMFDSRWGIDCEELLNRFEQLRSRFMVLGRLVNGQFMTGVDILAEHVKATGKIEVYRHRWERLIYSVDFRLDISSSELRGR